MNPTPVRVVHSGRSSCYAISGLEDKSTSCCPVMAIKPEPSNRSWRKCVFLRGLEEGEGGEETQRRLMEMNPTPLRVVHLGQSTCHAISGLGD